MSSFPIYLITGLPSGPPPSLCSFPSDPPPSLRSFPLRPHQYTLIQPPLLCWPNRSDLRLRFPKTVVLFGNMHPHSTPPLSSPLCWSDHSLKSYISLLPKTYTVTSVPPTTIRSGTWLLANQESPFKRPDEAVAMLTRAFRPSRAL